MRYLSFSITVLAGICFFFQSNTIFAQSKTEILKTETCWSYGIENNAPTTNGHISRQVEYNNQGRKTKETTYNKDGSIAYEYLFNYSANARETYWELSDGTKIKSETETYNDAGQLLERIRYHTDGQLQDRITVTYENGEKSKEIYFNQSNEITYSVNYAYGKGTKTIRESYTNSKGEKERNGATNLDENGLPKWYKEYEATGPLICAIEYKRDEEGRILDKITYAADEETIKSKEVFEYTENAKHCSIYVKGGTKLLEHVVCKYNYYPNK
jgi:antitoxin component YwqK of YwqJK toxin-antitoxin module